MGQKKPSTKVAGIDVGKRRLDVAIHGQEDETQVANSPAGRAELAAWLTARGVGRVGLEATGGYERDVREALAAAGFEVAVLQPLEVRLYGRWKKKRAKNDRLDARLIAEATAHLEAVKAAQDPRLAVLAEQLTAYEQASDQAAQIKGVLETTRQKNLIADFRRLLAAVLKLKAKLARQILAGLKAHDDLLARFRLLLSLPGVGPIVAATLVVRMPELGALRHGQAASLIGVAPFDRDSGQHKGQRFIAGGRSRPRRMLYLAGLAARRFDPRLRTFADGLAARGKPAKLIIAAVMRKLIEAANLVLSRGQPWLKQPVT
jgi:transposase